jgi:hypothetical protein
MFPLIQNETLKILRRKRFAVVAAMPPRVLEATSGETVD